MSSSWDILAELDLLIEDDMSKTTPKPIPGPPTRTVPTTGTRIQRSDAQNRRKAAMLLTPPPPPPRGRGKPAPPGRGCPPPEAPPMAVRKKPKIRPAVIPASMRPAATAPPPSTRPPTLLAAAAVRRAARTEPPPLIVLTISGDSSPPAPSPPAPSPPAPAPSPPPAAVPLPPPPSPPPPAAQGPELPPPITVEYAPGHHAAVPYFAATVSRQYKLRTASGERYKLRFSAGGRLLSSRKLPLQLPGSPRGGVM